MKRLIFFGAFAILFLFAIPRVHAQTSSETLQNVCSSVESTGNPPSDMSQSTLNGIETEMQGLSQVLTSLGTAVNTNGPSITGIQGYDPSTKSYTSGTITPGTYLVLYGTFSTNNTVLIDGTTVAPSYQSSNQINVPVSGIVAGDHIVTVVTASGATPPQLFTIGSANSGGSGTGPQLTIDGETSATFTSTGAWSLSLAAGSTYANTAFTICATINGNQTCTPNFGTTDANGNWTDSGSFSSSNNGSWTEWIEFPTTTGTGNVDSNQVSFTVGSSGTTTTPTTTTSTPTSIAPTTCNPSNITFPTTILVTAATRNVRSAPNTTASFAGSGTLYAGDKFTASNEVCGSNVQGNDLWWVSSLGNYVWSGGTTVESIGTTSSKAATPTAAATASNPSIIQVTIYKNTISIVGTFNASGDTVFLNGQALPVADYASSETAFSISVTLTSLPTLPFTLAVSDSQGTSPTFTVSAVPVLTSVQGYNPTTNKYEATSGVLNPGDTYIVLYGTFAASNNVVVNGTTVPSGDIVYQAASQINVSLGALATSSSSLNVFVSDTGGYSNVVNVVVNGGGNSISILPKISVAQLQSEIQNANFADAITIATKAGYLVYVSDDGVNTATAIISDPVTGAEVAAISEQDN